jgi:hypothetical protein
MGIATPHRFHARILASCAASTFAAWLLAGLAASPARAQTERFPVSPTGIPYTVPAAARAAGWTLAAMEARTGMIGSNPVFIGGGAEREIAADAAWEHRDIDESLAIDRFESRISSLTGKYSTGKVAVGVSYQRPFRAESETSPDQADLQVVLGALAVDVLPMLRVGGSLAGQYIESVQDVTTYQATVGAEANAGPLLVAGAVKSAPFGADAEDIAEPGWFQFDARFAMGPVASFGARVGVGWWNNDLDGLLDTPVDVGVGTTWGALPMLRVLGGVHHISERIASPEMLTGGVDAAIASLDQGTFLDLGVMATLPLVKIGLAVEDSHVFNADSPTTWVTLSANAAF